MDTTTSSGGVAEPARRPAADGTTVRVEVEAMPDGRTIRFYVAEPRRDPTDGAVRTVEATRGAVRSDPDRAPETRR